MENVIIVTGAGHNLVINDLCFDRQIEAIGDLDKIFERGLQIVRAC